MAEKRYLKRHRRRFALRFGQDEATRLGFTEDISKEGLFIRTANTYTPGTVLTVTILLPHETFITLKGKVVWAKSVPQHLARLVKKAGLGLKIECFIEGREIYLQACEKSLYPA
jgi:Tfp pilus assembly protein PilZ